MFRKVTAIFLSFQLALWPLMANRIASQGQPPLRELIELSYLDLLQRSVELNYPSKLYEQLDRQLKQEEKAEAKRLENEEKALKKQIKQQRKSLERLNRQASRDDEEAAQERRRTHCRILQLEDQLRNKQTERRLGLPVAFDNKRAKLELLQLWPAHRREIHQAIESGKARQRRWGNVEDIGIRVIRQGQEKDVQRGEEAIRELRAYGLIPGEIEDQAVLPYLRRLADQVARHSDLKIPLRVTLLDSQEINGFALPGGFLYLNRGLVERAETESELAGVIAHEIAHVTARHSARLMKKVTIASIIFQAAQVAALVFSGGTVGIGTYYALQYGFFGLGMVLNLTLLGVSRDFEEEADQLGVQYAWKAGYDPRGFITFFDKMASEKGYVRSASFFRTHPPFFKRIVQTFSEIEYLPRKEGLKRDSEEFQQIKQALAKLAEERLDETTQKPSLRRLPPCDDPIPPSR